ncbi:MAG TPA: hypothetical protein VFR76_07860 [Verrucomicrobiae bacterium]|nr:hypothetical protein [Verrucomicrobiae bacterium]
MKISAHNQGSRCRRPAGRRGEHGFLVIALLAIVAIMLIYVNINVRLLGNLKRELKLVEQQQIQRLEKVGAEPLPLTKAWTNEATASLARELGAPVSDPAR